MSLRGLGPDKDLVVDVGAYRSWPQYTPITHALITQCAPRGAPANPPPLAPQQCTQCHSAADLGLPVHCYDPGDDPCEKFNIATEEGSDRKAGFATFVEVMMTRLVDAGVL